MGATKIVIVRSTSRGVEDRPGPDICVRCESSEKAPLLAVVPVEGTTAVLHSSDGESLSHFALHCMGAVAEARGVAVEGLEIAAAGYDDTKMAIHWINAPSSHDDMNRMNGTIVLAPDRKFLFHETVTVYPLDPMAEMESCDILGKFLSKGLPLHVAQEKRRKLGLADSVDETLTEEKQP